MLVAWVVAGLHVGRGQGRAAARGAVLCALGLA